MSTVTSWFLGFISIIQQIPALLDRALCASKPMVWWLTHGSCTGSVQNLEWLKEYCIFLAYTKMWHIRESKFCFWQKFSRYCNRHNENMTFSPQIITSIMWHHIVADSPLLFPTSGPHWPATMFRFLQLVIFLSQEHAPVIYPRHENRFNSQRKETQGHRYHLLNLSKEGQHTCSAGHPHLWLVLPAQPQAITHENQKLLQKS